MQVSPSCSGGPGCGSEVVIFYENGPYSINEEDELVSNPNSWNSVATVMYIDQPIGTGFSSAEGEKYCTDGECAVKDLVGFLTNFFSHFPEYKALPFYITGESYAGHYIPPLAHVITTKHTDINLRGISIGNGIVDMGLQYQMFFELGILHGLIPQERLNEAINEQLLCVNDNPCAPLFSILTKGMINHEYVLICKIQKTL